VGAGGRARDVRGPELLGDEVDDTLLGLESPGDAEKRRRLGEDGVPREHARPEDNVHEPGLVLQRHEGHTLRRPRLQSVSPSPLTYRRPMRTAKPPALSGYGSMALNHSLFWTHRKAHMWGQEVCHGREEEEICAE